MIVTPLTQKIVLEAAAAEGVSEGLTVTPPLLPDSQVLVAWWNGSDMCTGVRALYGCRDDRSTDAPLTQIVYLAHDRWGFRFLDPVSGYYGRLTNNLSNVEQVVVSWGDGTQDTFESGSFPESASHTYADYGSYTVNFGFTFPSNGVVQSNFTSVIGFDAVYAVSPFE